MRVAEVPCIGRFPTVVHDPGEWWSKVDSAHSLERLSLNAAFWRLVSDPGALLSVLAPHSNWRGEVARMFLSLMERAKVLPKVDAFRSHATFLRAAEYNRAARSLAVRIALAESLQTDFALTTATGPILKGTNYEDANALFEAAARETALTRCIHAALETVSASPFDVYFVTVTSPHELATALILGRILKARHATHVCLVGHSYENYSLEPHLERLYELGLAAFIDTAVGRSEDRSVAVPWLLDQVERGQTPRGMIGMQRFSHLRPPRPSRAEVLPKVHTFSPEPILWTRISDGKCYWSRCAFCVQNNKHHSDTATSKTHVPSAIDRLRVAVAEGYRMFIFSDEALSPSVLRELSTGIVDTRLDIRWACRSKLEIQFDRDLFRLMRNAGCIEVLFGLESIVEQTQVRMDKFVPGLDAQAVKRILSDMRAEQVAAHLNVIVGFPGETFEQTRETVEFLIDALNGDRRSTFLLNEFALFVGSPMADKPEKFGLVPKTQRGDMPTTLDYRVASESSMPDGRRWTSKLRAHAIKELAWDVYHPETINLYFSTGHGCIIKGLDCNPFWAAEKGVDQGEKLKYIRNWWHRKHRKPSHFRAGVPEL